MPYSEEDSDSTGYESDGGQEITLDSIDKKKTINTSLDANYTSWRPREAFRELVQNWRDAIIDSFALREQDFCVSRKESRRNGQTLTVLYEVCRPVPGEDRKEHLGYIRFHEGTGTVDLVNRRATLRPRHLRLGGTSKAADDSQAGCHGEGLKIATLVMLGKNHNVTCRSGGFRWNFNFDKTGQLVVTLSRMSPTAVQREESKAQRLRNVPFVPKADGDVQFTINGGTKGRDGRGNKVTRAKVTTSAFNHWVEAALFLSPHVGTGVISTDAGDLITEEWGRGKIYLKGLLLAESTPMLSASASNLELSFGYNFATGATNRERQSITGHGAEARAIFAIWRRVLDKKPEMARELSEMLNIASIEYADVRGAKMGYADAAMASHLRNYLLGGESGGKWYYSNREKVENPKLHRIIEGLGCKAEELHRIYWDLLRRHRLLRTAEEEQQRRFNAAPALQAMPRTRFATLVHRLLRACLRACPQTRDIAVCFIQASKLHLDLVLSKTERLFKIHDRWLSHATAVQELGFSADMTQQDAVFHSVKHLAADALDQLPLDDFADGGDTGDDRPREWRRRFEIKLAEQRLLEFRCRSLGTGHAAPGKLCLSWTCSELKAKTSIMVQCHLASRCSHLRDTLLIAQDAQPHKLACLGTDVMHLGLPELGKREHEATDPTCRVRIHDGHAGSQWEEGLRDGEEYFFLLLTPDDPTSIITISDVVRTSRRAAPATSPLAKPAGSTETAAKSTPPSSALAPQQDRANQGRAGSPPTAGKDREAEVGQDGDASKKSLSSTKGAPSSSSRPTDAPKETSKRQCAGSFVFENRLESLNIFDIDNDRWYEANHSDGVRAVLGIIKGQKRLPWEPRKRKRVGD